MFGVFYDFYFLFTFIYDNGMTKLGTFIGYFFLKIELVLIVGILITATFFRFDFIRLVFEHIFVIFITVSIFL